jgi:sodium/bile acid cotransporter 7
MQGESTPSLPLWRRLFPDPFILVLMGAIVVAALLPARGDVAALLRVVTSFMIGLLFFTHGLRLAPAAVVAGVADWRLQASVLACTFLLFPALGVGLHLLVPAALPDALWVGVLYLCLLPSTVQTSVSFTALARGNVAAAVCAATVSNLVGIVLTPLLVALLLHASGGDIGLQQIVKVVVQLLLPFLAGQLLRPRLAAWAHRNRSVLMISDRSSILLSVYTAFSAAVVQGIWTQVPPAQLAALVLVCVVILIVVMSGAAWAGRALGVPRDAEPVLLFCGSHKSLASGIPIATVLFSGPALGTALLPLMIYHQLELMVGAVLAQRYAGRATR